MRSTTVRDLGVQLDQELSLTHHINLVSRSCFYQLRQLRVVSRSLTFNARVTLIHAFVLSRLDYCSSIYAGLPQIRIDRLERVHRAAARLIGGSFKTDHISLYMQQVLHWLPFPQRIYFRISSMVWKYLSGEAPLYLRELCCPVSFYGDRQLRSSTHSNLAVPFARTVTIQRRAFSVVGPATWNGLPLEVRNVPRVFPSPFYRLLKTVFSPLSLVGSASE